MQSAELVTSNISFLSVITPSTSLSSILGIFTISILSVWVWCGFTIFSAFILNIFDTLLYVFLKFCLFASLLFILTLCFLSV